MSSQARLGARTPMDVGSFSLMGGNGKPNRRQSWPLKSLGQYVCPTVVREACRGRCGAVTPPQKAGSSALRAIAKHWRHARFSPKSGLGAFTSVSAATYETAPKWLFVFNPISTHELAGPVG